MADQDQPGEDFDEDKLAGEYPPDRPLAVDDDGVTGLEQLGGESFAERDARTLPEEWEQRPGATPPKEQPGIQLAGDESVGAPDVEGESVGEAVTDPDARSAGPLASDDEFTGDETTRDVASERTTQPAEEAAVQVDDAPPGATP